MGRLSKSTPSVSVSYRKLVEDYTGSANSGAKYSNCGTTSASFDSLGKIMPAPAPGDLFSYSCHHCGHRQKLQRAALLIMGNFERTNAHRPVKPTNG
ncbi:unnamed protein product [Acanthoscelides obtectus]|uniref:Uncharacterized protein n=1 Tax=Acanthoscelides obtectus TaxID=200917 RepID=A0A9P0MIN3_ACAOB|nr:unnamed protein product [Acanthoscelides obtectus]CAH2015651.1 unnamed protein product [Acanthoscelides obtectus]CAK1676303.1 hypothetical protein AOBTE_LOCUS30679 [Acanthoscelides obtectus]CAK1676304.1 hypothetical protein AOBTE_LOCUS30680 [Acanthoscelides obtectus]